MKEKYKILLKDTAIFALGSFGSKLLLFLMVPIYTNYMSTDEYGEADLVFTVAQLLIPFLSVVIFDAVVRFGLSQNEPTSNVLLIGCIVWAIASVVTILFTPFFGIYEPIKEWKWYLCSYIIFNMANSIGMNYLKVKDLNKRYALLSIIQTGLMASLNVIFLIVFHFGVKGYLLAYIISNLLIDIIVIFASGIITDLSDAKFDRRLFIEMVKYSSPLILNNVSWWVIHSSDKVMIETMVGATALGIYTVSAKIPSLINVFVSIFQQAWGISSVKEIETSNDQSFYSNVFKVYTLLTCFACIVLVSIMKAFMSVYVGDSFQDSWAFVPLLLVSAVFASISSFFGSLYSALKKSLNNMFSTMIAAIVNIIVNLALIPILGIWGAVIGTVASYCIVSFYRIFDVLRFMKVDIDWYKLIANIIIITVQAAIVSMDYNIIITSVITFTTFVLINFKDIKSILNKGPSNL